MTLDVFWVLAEFSIASDIVGQLKYRFLQFIQSSVAAQTRQRGPIPTKHDVLFIHGEQDYPRRIIHFLISTAAKTTVDKLRQNTNSFRVSGLVLKI